MANSEDKANLGVAVVGDLGCGKSTLCGHFLYQLGLMSPREFTKLERESAELGKDSLKFAFHMDKWSAERQRGISIICSSRNFQTANYNYNLVDTPGYPQFVKSTIYGLSRADVAILVVAADGNRFELSIGRNHKTMKIGQTRQHSRLCWLMGIKQMIVVVNRMDCIGYNQQRFEAIKVRTTKLLQKMGMKKTHKIPFIPISAYKGENLVHKSREMPWFNGFTVQVHKKAVHGFTLFHALDTAVTVPNRKELCKKDQPFLMPIEGLYQIRGVGYVLCGRVEQGVLDLNECRNVHIYPRNFNVHIASMKQMHSETTNLTRAQAGDYIGCAMQSFNGRHGVRKGDVMMKLNMKLTDVSQLNSMQIKARRHSLQREKDKLNTFQLDKKVKQFEALVYVENHCGKLKCRQTRSKYNCRGYTPIVYVRNSKSPCKLVKILWKRKHGSDRGVAYFPTFIEYGDIAQVIFEPRLDFFVTPFEINSAFGRLAVMDHSYLIMIGKVLHVYHTDDELLGVDAYMLLNGFARPSASGKRNAPRELMVPEQVMSIIHVYYGSYDKVESEQTGKSYRPLWWDDIYVHNPVW